MKNQNKNIYRALLILSFIGLNLLLVSGISSILSYLNTGADKSKMLNLALGAEPVYKPQLVWKDSINPSRPIEKPTKKRVAQDYLNAWYVREVALATGETKGIADYYTSNAREKITRILTENKAAQTRIESTSLNHELHLEFYSADGQLISFTDQNVLEVQRVFSEDQLVLQTRDTSDYRVIMLLEDGFWRIRQLVRIPKKSVKASVVNIPQKKLPKWIKGVNYYPQESAWNTFGASFNPETLAADFKKIKALHLNTIRIFIGYEDFGAADVTEDKLNKLNVLLDLAKEHELNVIITLFDIYGDYSVLDMPNTFKHAATIINTFKTHPALLAWDIKNEPDLDYKNRGEDLVNFWLKNQLDHIKNLDPETPVTIGWSTPEAAVTLAEKLDLVSFHYYRDFENFETSYTTLKEATNKPLMLQEFGLSTYRGFWNPFGASEQKQAEYYNTFLSDLKQKNLHFAIWTLYDYTEVPTGVVGRLPWRKAPQKHFGILKENTTDKKAAQVFKESL